MPPSAGPGGLKHIDQPWFELCGGDLGYLSKGQRRPHGLRPLDNQGKWPDNKRSAHRARPGFAEAHGDELGADTCDVTDS